MHSETACNTCASRLTQNGATRCGLSTVCPYRDTRLASARCAPWAPRITTKSKWRYLSKPCSLLTTTPTPRVSYELGDRFGNIRWERRWANSKVVLRRMVSAWTTSLKLTGHENWRLETAAGISLWPLSMTNMHVWCTMRMIICGPRRPRKSTWASL